LLIPILTAFLSSQSSYSQNTPNTQTKAKDTVPFIRFGNISTKFTKSSLELTKGSIVSNVLKVVNHDQRPVRFTVDALFPGGWTRIDDANKLYVVQPKDTIIVPIIISPTKIINGDTEIIINVFVIDQNGQQIGNNFFTLTTKKKIAWGIGLANNTSYYFKNNENYKDFTFSIDNNGNYRQDIYLSFTRPREDLILADTLSSPLEDPSKTFTLEAGESRKFTYRAIATTFNERNRKRISINNFSPTANKERENRILIINSSEPRIQKKSLQKRTKVNFVKLPNEITAQPYGYPNLPLIVDVNAQNVLDERSFLSINLQGFKQLDRNSSLIYFTQFNYSNSFFTNNVFRNVPWYVGYFDEKKTIEIGQVNGELIGASAAGKGIKASYRFNDKHRGSVFYTNSAGFLNFNEGITSYGGSYRLKYNEDIRLFASLGRSENNIVNRTSTVATLQPSVRFLDNHSIGFIGGINSLNFELDNVNITRNGYLLGTNYTTTLLKRKIRSNINIRFSDRNFSNGTNERLFINQRFTYNLSKEWLTIFAGNYQKIRLFNNNTEQFLFNQETLFTNISFSKRTETGSYQPGLFYEYRDFPNNAFSIRGINFRYAAFDIDNNYLSAIFLRAGYARPRSGAGIEIREYFSLETNGLFRYRTWNVTARYNLGTFSAISLQQNQNENLTPQSIRIALQNQYMFSNRSFVIEPSLIYSFNNIFQNHTLGLFPQLYYFTKSGWRFGISANYIYTSSDFSSVFDFNDPNNPGQQNLGPTINSDFNLNFNLRKEFGIPIPFTKKEAATTNVVAFLDINGNSVKEKDETSLENVVIKLNRKEVITDYEGTAKVNNIPYGKYKLDVLSLEDQNGWFPNVQDSIFIEKDGITHIPFVRGVKVYGDVIVDRQKIAVSDDKPLDLSRIKISAVKGDKVYNTLTNTDGRFEFYLPFGEYIITMDEGILGERFRVTRNNLNVRLRNNQDGAYVSFYIVEKRRKVIFKDFTKKKKQN
jgi:hypothetical protein